MQLDPLMTLRANIGETLEVGDVATGVRRVASITGGDFEGERLRGTVQASGGDWLVVGSDGVGRLDVRVVLTTDDGANLYLNYTGLIEYNDAIVAAFQSGGSTEYGDALLLTQIRFEAGDERYGWLNRCLGVAEGRLLPGAVEYRVYTLRAG